MGINGSSILFKYNLCYKTPLDFHIFHAKLIFCLNETCTTFTITNKKKLVCFNFRLPTPYQIETAVPIETENLTKDNPNEERYLPYDYNREPEVQEEGTQDILEKIKAINEGLKKPQRQQINFNKQPNTNGGYVINKELLDKIQQIIASGKLNGLSGNQKQQESNYLNNDDLNTRYGNAKALRYVQPTLASNSIVESHAAVALVPVPYMATVPIVLTPAVSGLGAYPMDNDINSQFATRQRPSLPFPIQWPLAQYFPILLKDPLLHYLGGGNWDTLFEYGQSADVCNRKQKSSENTDGNLIEKDDEVANEINLALEATDSPSLRQGRAIKKRTVSKSTPLQEVNTGKKTKKFFKVPTTVKPAKKNEGTIQDTKSADPNEGDLRFPFSDFTWFGNRKPVAPSPGFFINRLKVRRGGVAIAGPGGVATAGRGGTALVGPGGLAYTQPGGLAVAGPAARVVALSSDADLSSIVQRLQQQSATDGSIPRLLEAIPEGKVVATGPVIYYHPYD